MRNVIIKILDYTFYAFIRSIIRNTRRVAKSNLIDQLENRAINSSLDYVNKNMKEAMYFRNTHLLWDYALSKKKINGMMVEFGVYKGHSINFFASKCDQQIFGFDSFIGLKEDWKGRSALVGMKGNFNNDGRLPNCKKNVTLIKGWFNETVPTFLIDNKDFFSFIHIDCDTYESTSAVFNLIQSRIKEGTIIVFDDYFGEPGWEINDFKAFREFVLKNEIKYDYIAFSLREVVVRIN